jgi:hypothetical protein
MFGAPYGQSVQAWNLNWACLKLDAEVVDQPENIDAFRWRQSEVVTDECSSGLALLEWLTLSKAVMDVANCRIGKPIKTAGLVRFEAPDKLENLSNLRRWESTGHARGESHLIIVVCGLRNTAWRLKNPFFDKSARDLSVEAGSPCEQPSRVACVPGPPRPDQVRPLPSLEVIEPIGDVVTNVSQRTFDRRELHVPALPWCVNEHPVPCSEKK